MLSKNSYSLFIAEKKNPCTFFIISNFEILYVDNHVLCVFFVMSLMLLNFTLFCPFFSVKFFARIFLRATLYLVTYFFARFPGLLASLENLTNWY